MLEESKLFGMRKKKKKGGGVRACPRPIKGKLPLLSTRIESELYCSDLGWQLVGPKYSGVVTLPTAVLPKMQLFAIFSGKLGQFSRAPRKTEQKHITIAATKP